MHRILASLTLLACVSASVAALGQGDVDLGSVTEKHVMIPMRDGQHLSAFLYFPPGDGPWPAAFEQRYADLRGAGTRKAAAQLAEAGFVVAMVNFRGTYLSEGTWVGYRALAWGELQDGYDTCEWLATQPWCTGKIGTFGSSQAGYAQNFLAVAAPPHLICEYMVDTGLSLFQEGYRIGGTTRPQRFQRMNDVCRNPDDNQALMAEWFRHPTYDDYWRQEDCSLHFDKMNVPCFTIGSWYDFMNQGSVASYIGRQHTGGPNSRGKQQLVIGPWLHGRLNKGNRVGDLEYPANAAWPENDHMVRWFNHFLKGEDNGVDREPAVRYYVMGAVGEEGAPGNVWREATDFPPPAEMRPLYLQAGGQLSAEAPAAEASRTSYESEPRHPMEIPGTAFPGAQDARPFEQQSQVLTFTTEPLPEPVEWTGRIKAELYVSSTARDTDFIVRVSDVYPDGRSILLVDYPWRARYRDGFEKEVPLEPGQVARVAFDVGWVSQIFNRGHCIRVTVASTGAPLYEPNPQTGEALTIEFPENTIAATNTIHHERGHASRILAPVPAIAGAQAPTPRLARDNLLVYRDESNQPAPVKTVDDWLKRRAEIIRGMEAIMGTLPGDEKRCPLDMQIEEEVDCGAYVRRLMTYASEPGSRVPAYLCIPKAALEPNAKPVPAVLCLHGTDNVVGHGIVVGLGNRPNRQYASELAERGYVTLAPNYPLLAKYQPDIKSLGWESGTLKAVWDNIRGLDLLESLPYVKPGTFGAIGHSLGGHNSVYTSVFDDRIKVVVSSCGLDSYLDYYGGDEKNWYPEKGWCQTRYMLRLADYRGRLEDIPFDFHELIGALAPRHVFIIAPLHDGNFVASSVDRIAAAARPVFELYGHPERLRVEHPDCEHDFPQEMREAAYKQIDEVLQ